MILVIITIAIVVIGLGVLYHILNKPEDDDNDIDDDYRYFMRR
jgi:hypothetical protein